MKFCSNSAKFATATLLLVFVAPCALAAEEIVAVRQDGRTIYVNKEEPAAPTAAPAAYAAPRKLIYWSNTEHRWKRVPRPSNFAYRNAQAAALEVSAMVAQSPKQDMAPPELSHSLSPQTRAMVSGHRMTPSQLDDVILAAAQRHNVDVDLVRALIKVESNFNPHAVSNKGAMGLMQLMPRTARDLGVANPFDPEQNVEGGVRHFKGLLEGFNGNVPLSLAAYNAGAGAVARNGGVPPYTETRNYVNRITQLYGAHNAFTAGPKLGSPIRVQRDSDGHKLFTNE
jgi:soluble lytic murein transglycosylase-like protein